MIGFNYFLDLEAEDALWDSVRPYVVGEDGSNPRPIAESLGNAHFSGWAPDGRHALVSPIRDERQMVFHRDYLLHIADVDGGIPRNVRRLDTGNPFDFVVHWSSTGEWILLVCGPYFKRSDPWLIRPDGSESHLLTARSARSRV